MQVKIINTDDRLGVKAGEIYEAKRYRFDPHEKVELMARVPDGYDPLCTQYLESVLHMIGGKWHKIEDNRYVPVDA